MLTSYGPNVDKKCVQEAVNKLQSSQAATNKNQKSTSGSDMSLGLKTGGNTTGNSNATVGGNTNAVSSTAETSGKGTNTTENASRADTSNAATNQNTLSTSQTSKASATGTQMGIGQGSGSGPKDGLMVIVLIMIVIYVLYYLEETGSVQYYSTTMNYIMNNQLFVTVMVAVLFTYLFKR